MLFPALVVCSALSAAGDTVLIDFSATWCGPCRQMEPVVGQLAKAGYPVRKVDIDQERELASQFRIGPIPCFVLVVGGREVDRIVGGTSYEQLEGLLKKHGVPTGSQVNQTRGQSPDAGRSAPRLPATRPVDDRPKHTPVANVKSVPVAREERLDPNLANRLIASSVRLKIGDAKGHSFGSGTIIDAQGNDALVLTCGHIFRESQGKGSILIDTFGAQAERGLAGRLIGYDLQSDVGLVTFRPNQPVSVARVAAGGYQARRGDAVISIGCNNGQDPTARQSRISGIDKFLGPPNLQVAGQPVTGRSGGGLFNAEGRVIGVCNAADPTDDEGLFAALPSINAELDRRGLSKLTQPGGGVPAMLASHADRLDAPSQENAPPAMPQRMPAVTSSGPMLAGTTEASRRMGFQPVPSAAADSIDGLKTHPTLDRMSSEQRALLGALGNPAAEVICIVRSRNQANGQSEVVVLDKASTAFLQQLAAEQRTQQTQQTSLAVSSPGAGNVQHLGQPVNLSQPPTDNRAKQVPIAKAMLPVKPAAIPRPPAWQPPWLRK